MRSRKSLTIVATTFIAAVADSDGFASGETFDGNTLYSLCTSENVHEVDYCTAFIAGALGGARNIVELLPNDEAPFCAEGITNFGQMKDIVVDYLKEHPEIRHYDPAALPLIAFSARFPCQ